MRVERERNWCFMWTDLEWPALQYLSQIMQCAAESQVAAAH